MNRMISPLGVLDFLENRLQPLLELAAVLGARDHRAEIERHQALALQCLRHVTIDDANGEAFDDGGFADARLADQHRVVLGAPCQHLDCAANFLVAADDRVELALARERGDVPRVLLQCVERSLGVLAVDLAALANVVDRLLQRLRGRAGTTQRAGGRAVDRGERKQQAILRDILVARLLAQPAEQRRARARGSGVSCGAVAPLPCTFGTLRQFRLDGDAGELVVAPGGADQASGRSLLVVQESLEQVFRRKLLVEFTHRNGLGSLNEAARPFGEFLNIHFLRPFEAT